MIRISLRDGNRYEVDADIEAVHQVLNLAAKRKAPFINFEVGSDEHLIVYVEHIVSVDNLKSSA